MRFGSTAKVLAKCKLKYYRISECVAQVLSKSGTAGSLASAGDQDLLAAVGTFLSGAAAIGTSDLDPAPASHLSLLPAVIRVL